MAEKALTSYSDKTPASGDKAFGIDSGGAATLLNLGSMAGEETTSYLNIESPSMAPADATDAPSAITQLNALIAVLVSDGVLVEYST